jgi:hypothetical protein
VGVCEGEDKEIGQPGQSFTGASPVLRTRHKTSSAASSASSVSQIRYFHRHRLFMLGFGSDLKVSRIQRGSGAFSRITSTP